MNDVEDSLVIAKRYDDLEHCLNDVAARLFSGQPVVAFLGILESDDDEFQLIEIEPNVTGFKLKLFVWLIEKLDLFLRRLVNSPNNYYKIQAIAVPKSVIESDRFTTFVELLYKRAFVGDYTSRYELTNDEDDEYLAHCKYDKVRPSRGKKVGKASAVAAALAET